MNILTSLGIHPTLAFWVSLLPVPGLLYLNYKVAVQLRDVRRLSRGRTLRYPKLYFQGRILGVIALGFALLPPLIERRIFVLSPWWSILYLAGGALGILGLRLVQHGLTIELRRLRANPPSSRSQKR